MQCREAQEFFSPYLDGELTTGEIAALQQHLAGCPACRVEVERWREFSRALRGLQAPVAAPPGFAAAVMARVAGPDRVAGAAGAAGAAGRTGLIKARPWQGVRRWIAAAAAVALLAAGSIGYAARGLWQHLPSPVALVQPDGSQMPGSGAGAGSPGPGIQQPGVQPPGADLPPAQGDTPPAQAGGQQPGGSQGDQTPAPVTASGNRGQGADAPGTSQPAPAGNGKTDSQPTRVANGDTYTPRAFLSTGYQATSTMLKVAVSDMVAAKGKALSLAGSSGARVQVIADQDNGSEKKAVYQMAVPEGQAAGLLEALSRLGQVTGRNTSTQDLTQHFSTLLEQYRAKVAQVNTASDPAEKEKLTREAKALEQQLATWEEATRQQTIILWLETK